MHHMLIVWKKPACKACMLMLKGSGGMHSRKFLKAMFSKMESRGIFQVQS